MTLLGTSFSICLTFLDPFVIGATCAWCLAFAAIMTMLPWLTAQAGSPTDQRETTSIAARPRGHCRRSTTAAEKAREEFPRDDAIGGAIRGLVRLRVMDGWIVEYRHSCSEFSGRG
jgi:hypothetical protein